ncbi:GTP-binding protein [Nocardia acidivorans]|uniref:GTP-binding protein n=1 Tax=Nocardia acidivorans TaxID=404580 RepID=UPI00082FD351|nr:GTP-binding protein [Nocardia acidivorans]
MGTKAIDPQSIRNVTIIGDPEATTRLSRRLRRSAGTVGSGEIHWSTARVEHTIRIAELSGHAPAGELERSIRVADGVIALAHAGRPHDPQLEAMLRIADDHQVARLCLIDALDHPAADFDGCVRSIADTRGAVPLTLHLPLGQGTGFEGVIDLLPLWALEPLAAEIYGPHWELAEQRYRLLIKTVMEQDTPDSNAFHALRDIPLEQVQQRIRSLTRIGDVVPILCGAPHANDELSLLDAIIRYLPSPLEVCQPEHALDY